LPNDELIFREIFQNKKLMDIIGRERLPKEIIETDNRIHNFSEKNECFDSVDDEKISENKMERNAVQNLLKKIIPYELKLRSQLTKFLLNPDLTPILGENLKGLSPVLVNDFLGSNLKIKILCTIDLHSGC
jgi:hypothetical protein